MATWTLMMASQTTRSVLMIEVRQWTPSSELEDLINDEGWDANEETKAYASKWSGKIDANKWFHKYAHVANVESNDLEEVFHLLNAWDEPERVNRLADVYSLSVGDILTKDGTNYLVAKRGFTQLTQ